VLGERIYTWTHGHERSVDVGTAVGLTAGCVVFGIVVAVGPAYFLLSLALLLPLTVRRRWPVPCALAVLAAALVQWLTVRDTIGMLPADVAVPVVVHACAAHGPSWARRLVLAGALAGAGLGGLSWPQLPVPVWAHVLVGAFLASTVVAAWAMGNSHRVRQAQLVTLAERAQLLEVEREQRERLAVLAERTRIAREMHDVVAHSLAVLIAQADGGRYAAESSPQAAQGALRTIAECARQALAETRRVVGVLRDGPAASAVPGPPQPGIDDVAELVERVRAGGLDVRLTLRPPPRPVEPGLALAVYRIVQEGLTNVLKHAGPAAQAEVSVRWVTGELEIDVRDDGRGAARAPATGGGYGVLGMRERAGAYGGTVTLRPRPGGGRILSARIPVPS
jgi:signal transduction histidine kinase